MATKKDGKGCLVLLCLLVCLIPIIGGIWYGIQREKEINFIQTNCLTLNYSIVTESCGIRDICYKPLWTVSYNTNDFKQMISSIKSSLFDYGYGAAVKRAEIYGVNKTSICFYDHRRHNDVQWDIPDSKPGLIIMIIGLVLFVIIGSFTCYFVGPMWIKSMRECWQNRDVEKEHQQLIPKTVKFKHHHHHHHHHHRNSMIELDY